MGIHVEDHFHTAKSVHIETPYARKIVDKIDLAEGRYVVKCFDPFASTAAAEYEIEITTIKNGLGSGEIDSISRSPYKEGEKVVCVFSKGSKFTGSFHLYTLRSFVYINPDFPTMIASSKG